MADQPVDETQEIIIRDSTTSSYELKVNSDGSLNVSNVPPVTPPSATAITISAFGDVASTAGVDTYYTITSGKNLIIQQLDGGSQEITSGSVIELFYDINGNLSVLTRISTLFINGVSIFVPINEQFTGDGTARIVLRRRGYTANAREMFARWKGYEE